MKYYLISDNVDTLAGMRLVGVDGVLAHTRQEVQDALREACSDENVGIVLITSVLVQQNRDMVFDYKLNKKRPLIVEMPDRHSKDDVGAGIKKYISEVVGIKI